MGKNRFPASLVLAVFVLSVLWPGSLNVHAQGIPDDTDFADLVWEKEFEIESQNGGVIQGMTVSEDYIYCIENTADDLSKNDLVMAFYRNDTDADGNPVEQYSLAMQNKEDHWERGNGMAYNPNTHEIYVAPNTNLENLPGYVFVMDPDTLRRKGEIEVSTMYNLLGIAYDETRDQYMIQADENGEYAFKILDANWQLVETLGPANLSPGVGSQDMCLVGDYIINSPMDQEYATPYINIYSIERKEKIATINMGIDLEGAARCEPQSVIELEPGRIMVAVDLYYAEGDKKTVFYSCDLPYYFSVTTSAGNGTISEGSSELTRGSSFEVSYAPEKGFVLDEILVDGVPVDAGKFKNGYKFTDIDNDHTVSVSYLTKKDKKAKDKGKTVTEEPTDDPDGDAAGTDDGDQKDKKQAKKEAKAAKKEGKRHKGLKVFFSILLILVILFAGWYLYMLYLKRQRRRRREAARARRQAMLEEERREAQRGWDE